MPINPLENIYAFPTHSPKQHECMWIFYHHIKSIKPDPQNTYQSIITFNNYKELLLNISIHTLERQIHRTSYCILRFSHHSFSNCSSLFYSSLNENIHPLGGPL
jgi:competence protein ComK